MEAGESGEKGGSGTMVKAGTGGGRHREGRQEETERAVARDHGEENHREKCFLM